MTDMMLYAAALLAVWNIVVFALYGIDKGKAKCKRRRISEKALLLAALFFGAIGAFVGIQVFRHKTRHRRFTIGVPLLLLVNVAVLFWIGSAVMTDRPVRYSKITPQEAMARMEDGRIVLLDVRTAEEFAESHIADALLIPYDELALRAAAELPDKNATILVYCRSGRRSEIAAKELIGMGYRRVHDFGGILEWPYKTVTEG